MIKTPLSTAIGGVGFYTKNSLIIGSGKTEPPFDPASLFKNGEQGFWLDPSDLSTMFQDSAGTIPVTGAGQPVGLILDKSKGLHLGVNQMTYPNSQSLPASVNMADGVHTWTLNTQNPISGVQDSRLVVSEVSSAEGRPTVFFTLTTPLVAGKVYKFSFKYKVNSGSPRIRYIHKGDNTTSISIDKGTLTGSGTFEVYVQWHAGGQVVPYIYFSNASVFDIQMNEFSIQEVLGNHAYQTTSASRPILRQNATTGAYYLEFDGSDDFLQTSNIDFTTTDKVSLFAGVRKLSDATRGVVFEFGSSSSLSGSFGLYAPNYTNQLSVAFSAKGTLGAAFPHILNLIAPLSFVVTAKASIPDDAVSLKVNNLNQHISTDLGVGNFGNYPLYIGRRTGTSLPFNGHIYSLIGVGRLVTDAETKALEKELAKLTGVSLNV